MVISDAVQTLERELREIFGSRLLSLVVYGSRAQPADHGHGAHGHDAAPTHTLGIVEAMTADDLRACALRTDAWHTAGLATPLLIANHEFEQSLDAFPLEFGAILADHTIVFGANPFASLAIDPADLRHACEVQARSHLLHLRGGYLESRGNAGAVSVLIVRSAPAFAALITGIARLEGHTSDDAASAARHVERLVGMPGSAIAEVTALAHAHEISSADAERIFPPYLAAVTKLVAHVDGWSAA